MPGIAGIISPTPNPGIEQDLDRMLAAMRHEPFMRGQRYINRELGLYVGWMCPEGSFSDCMPLVDEERGLVVIFQGEHFFDADSIARLKLGGRDFTARDLSGLHGAGGTDEFLRSLNGWFNGVVVDLGAKKVTLFNDRYAMGRVYYAEGNGEFLFGSEAKSLLKVRPVLRVMDPASLAEYFRRGCVMGNRTFFRGISLLPNGSAWEFERGALVRRKAYFNFADWESQPLLGQKEFYNQFAQVVSGVFPSYVRGAAMSLTAGLDTRVIMASLEADCPSLPCYTFGGTWGETYDIRTARKIAHLFGQSHDLIRLNDHFFKNFTDYARRCVYISDGTHEALGAHDVFFSEMARRISPVRLTGKFGSEVVRTRKLVPWMEVRYDFMTRAFQEELDRVPRDKDASGMKHPLSRVVHEDIPWFEYGRVAIEQSQVALRTPYMDNQLVKLLYQAPFELRASGYLQAQYVREKSPRLNAILTNLSRSGEGGRIKKEVLYWMFWSLFKAEYIYLFATPHWATWIDRRLEKLHLERFIAGRQKFEAYRIWLRTEMAQSVRDILLKPDAQLTQFYDKASVERVVRQHLAGTHNHLFDLGRMMTIELMCDSLLKA